MFAKMVKLWSWRSTEPWQRWGSAEEYVLHTGPNCANFFISFTAAVVMRSRATDRHCIPLHTAVGFCSDCCSGIECICATFDQLDHDHYEHCQLLLRV